MDWLFGSPWPILFGGLAIVLVLLVALVRSGRGALLAAMVGVGVLTAVLLVAERMIVTDTEQVAITLDELATALKSNNESAVADFLAPEATALRATAKAQLPLVTINDAHVGSDLEIELSPKANPTHAQAKFTGTFQFHLKRETSPYDRLVMRFRIDLERRGSRWLVVHAEWDKPLGR